MRHTVLTLALMGVVAGVGLQLVAPVEAQGRGAVLTWEEVARLEGGAIAATGLRS